MGENPRVVTADTTFLWDHAPQRLGRGTIIDVPAGGALEQAIGRDKLKPLFGAPPVTVPLASVPAPEPAQAAGDAPEDGREAAPQPPARSRRSAAQAAARDSSSGKGGTPAAETDRSGM